jgi:hypothetical protein
MCKWIDGIQIVDNKLVTHHLKDRYMELTLQESYGYLNVVANNIGKLTLKVCSATNGRIAKKICKDIMTGVHKLDLNINDLSTGTYILNTFNGDVFLKSFKFEKQ